MGSGFRRPSKVLDHERRVRKFPEDAEFPKPKPIFRFEPACAIRFWGHDSAMEWSFSITEDALKRLEPDLQRDEADLLRAFDAHRSSIYAAAVKA